MINSLSKIFVFSFILTSCKTKEIIKENFYRDSVVIRDTILKYKPETFFVYDTIREKIYSREIIDKSGNKIIVKIKDSLIYVNCEPRQFENILKNFYIKEQTKTNETKEIKKDSLKDYFFMLFLCLLVLLSIVYLLKFK